jgi:hypothetical protein
MVSHTTSWNFACGGFYFAMLLLRLLVCSWVTRTKGYLPNESNATKMFNAPSLAGVRVQILT